MTQKKSDLKRIANDKTRMTTYKKRKACLYKKAEEFSTLCGVETCLIVYGPTKATDVAVSEPEIWPRDETKATGIIRRYRNTVSNTCRKESHVDTFVNDIGNPMKMENKMKRVKSNKNKYCSWENKLDKCSQEQLREIFYAVDSKLHEAIMRRDRVTARVGDHATPIQQILMDQQYFTEQQQQQFPYCSYNNMGLPFFSPSHDDETSHEIMDPSLVESFNELGSTQGLMMPKGNDSSQFMQRQAPYYYIEPVVPKSAALNVNPFASYQGPFIPWR